MADLRQWLINAGMCTGTVSINVIKKGLGLRLVPLMLITVHSKVFGGLQDP